MHGDIYSDRLSAHFSIIGGAECKYVCPIIYSKGITLIELMIVLVILAVLLALGVPSIRQWIEDTKIRSIAASIHSGTQLARGEAIRLNELVRFQLTSDLTDSCVLSGTAANWVVSIDNPTAGCDAAPAPQATILSAASPRIIQTSLGSEGGGSGYTINADGNTLVFNGAGRLSAGSTITNIEIPDFDGRCQHQGGTLRCLRIRVLAGGDAIICDPKVTATSDVRFCPN